MSEIGNPTGAFGYTPIADAERVSENLAVGLETMPRFLADNTGLSTGSGTLRFVYFTPPYNFTTTSVRMATGGTAAATVTLIRIGLYIVDITTGNLTLVAATPNDATLFAAPSTMYTKNWSAPYTFLGGFRYAVSPLIVATTPPTLAGRQPGGAFAAEFALEPRLASSLTGQSDLPATIAFGSLVNVGGYAYTAFG